MSKKRVFITHGYQSSPTRNWFRWLRKQLEEKDVLVSIPILPNPDEPDREKWLATLRQEVGIFDKNTFFVAHSLGCITDLYFLDANNSEAGGLILVAGFAEQLKELPELTKFSSAPINFENIISKVPQRIVFGSPQDYIVPFDLTKNMAKNLDAELVSVQDSGHFMQEDGYDTFPALLIALQNMMDI